MVWTLWMLEQMSWQQPAWTVPQEQASLSLSFPLWWWVFAHIFCIQLLDFLAWAPCSACAQVDISGSESCHHQGQPWANRSVWVTGHAALCGMGIRMGRSVLPEWTTGQSLTANSRGLDDPPPLPHSPYPPLPSPLKYPQINSRHPRFHLWLSILEQLRLR